MQPQDGNEQYQTPSPQISGAPYQSVNEVQLVTEAPVDAPAPAEAESILGSVALDSVEVANSSVQNQDDEAVLHWDSPEYLTHDRDKIWYVIFGVITLALMAIAIFLIKSVSFAVLIPVMALALFVYTHRIPQILHYTLSRQGVHVNDRLFPYDMFKSFAVDSRNGNHAVILLPRKRFQLGLTAYFPEEVGEPLVDMLAARLPMQDHSPDFIDRLLAKLRI